GGGASLACHARSVASHTPTAWQAALKEYPCSTTSRTASCLNSSLYVGRFRLVCSSIFQTSLGNHYSGSRRCPKVVSYRIVRPPIWPSVLALTSRISSSESALIDFSAFTTSGLSCSPASTHEGKVSAHSVHNRPAQGLLLVEVSMLMVTLAYHLAISVLQDFSMRYPWQLRPIYSHNPHAEQLQTIHCSLELS